MTAGIQPNPSNRGRRLREWRPDSASLVSVAAHVVLGILVWNALKMPAVFDEFMRRDDASKPVAERVEFVTIAPSLTPAPAMPQRQTRQRPAGAPAAAPPQAVPLTAPTEIPTTIPAPAAPAEVPVPGATGPLRGGNGPTRGVQPNYDDPRVWPGPPEFIYAPKTDQERLDSALITSLYRHMDSVAAGAIVPNKFERGDWTVGSGNSKVGVDQQYIHLGRFKIPSAVLALLPLPYMQSNPVALDRDRNAAYMRADILNHAQAAMNEEQFRKAVKAIRDRKDREKRTHTRVSPNSTGPLTSPGERPPPE